MSTMLEGQLVAWRGPARTRERARPVEVLRVVVIVTAVAAAVAYFATMSETPAVVSGLLREARAQRDAGRLAADQEPADDRPAGIEVALRRSALDPRPLAP
jgi:hypothetical protein